MLEELLELPAGKLALDKFLAESHFSSVLLSPPISGDVKSSSLPTHIIKFFIKLFQLGELFTNCHKELILLCRRKGERHVYSSHRGVSLLSVVDKVFIKRIKEGTDRVLMICLEVILLYIFIFLLQRKKIPRTILLPQCAAGFQWVHGWSLASCKAGCLPICLLHHLQVMVKPHQQAGSF